MARRDLERLNLDPDRVRSRTDFLESYANTTVRELEIILRQIAFPEAPGGSRALPDMGWILTMDAASTLREAASWAVYFDVDRAIALLNRAGSLYRSVDMAFGSFLLAVAGVASLNELSNNTGLLARAHGRVSQAGPSTIPDSLHHPQQQVYLLLACAGMANTVTDERRRLGSIDEGSSYRQELHE